MSSSTSLTHKEAVPVVFGDHTVYTEKLKVTMTRILNEASTYSGTGVFTSNVYRAVRITLTGRISDDDDPMDFLIFLNTNLRSQRTFNFNYRNAHFTSCYIQHFEVEDIGADYTSVSLTLFTMERISEVTP